jgi:uncharacterized membrane protein
MQKDTNQTQVEEPRGDSGGYSSSPQPQQVPGSDNVVQGGQGDGYQRYNQRYSQGSQQQPPYWQPPQNWQKERYWQQQPYGAPTCCDVGPFALTSLGMRTRTAGWLSYLLGWVTGLIFFLLEKENRFVRFHATQSILFFGGISILEAIISFFEMLSNYTFIHVYGVGLFSSVLGLVSFIFWIVLMVRASKGMYYKLPVIGDFADKLIDQIHV